MLTLKPVKVIVCKQLQEFPCKVRWSSREVFLLKLRVAGTKNGKKYY